jgi:Fe-S-cluster containining protein
MVCSRCGKCCKYLVFIVPYTRHTDDELRYYKLRGVMFERINRNTDRMIVPCRCSLLGEDNLCMDFENRPDVCRKDKRSKNQQIWKPPGCTDED